MLQYLLVFLVVSGCQPKKLSYNLNLPQSHIPYYLNTYPQLAKQCSNDEQCPLKMHLNKKVCWGYEADCPDTMRYSSPTCPGDHQGWVKTKNEQINTFYTQGDFGYVKKKKDSLTTICAKQQQGDSMLSCTDSLELCIGENIMLDLRTFNRTDNIQYKDDVLSAGQLGGHCRLNKNKLVDMGDYKGVLQSWLSELKHFSEFSFRPIDDEHCDIVVSGRTFVIKLDAAVNMYHHFCDFFNLYSSLHVNNTHPDAFSTDVNVILWLNVPYASSFQATWNAFTHHPLTILSDFAGNRVCFPQLMLPLLPRMIFGLFYNTPLIYGCENSGLFDSFNKFMLHRLGIQQRNYVEPPKINVTLLSRQSEYRNILNEDELINRIKQNPKYVVRKVVYNWGTNFVSQIESTHNSDIFIGMHGAGLTHCLFLPDWAVLFELYNCNDEHCYKDLARLRGVSYITWENMDKIYPQDEGRHPTLGAHEKFTNYRFDVEEFTRLIDKAAKLVTEHPEWKRLHPQFKHDEL